MQKQDKKYIIYHAKNHLIQNTGRRSKISSHRSCFHQLFICFLLNMSSYSGQKF